MPLYEELHRFRMAAQGDGVRGADTGPVYRALNGQLASVRAAFIVLDMEAPEALRDLASEALTAQIAVVDEIRALVGTVADEEMVPASTEFLELLAAADTALMTARTGARAALD